MKILNVVLFCAAIFSILSCNSDPEPRPKGYFRIQLPEKKYELFNRPEYPYSFEYPVYAQVIKDSTFFDDVAENPYWINLSFPQFDAKIHISYKNITDAASLQKMVDDAFNLTGKHSIKANAIDELPIQGADHANGFLFDVGGNAATGKQFYLTDSTRNFIRGALYFNATPNYDSIKPVEDFLYRDIEHFIKTFRWTNR
jgi:gliding motility-associated lipoprotein GldD